jgi:hypothetical protein
VVRNVDVQTRYNDHRKKEREKLGAQRTKSSRSSQKTETMARKKKAKKKMRTPKGRGKNRRQDRLMTAWPRRRRHASHDVEQSKALTREFTKAVALRLAGVAVKDEAGTRVAGGLETRGIWDAWTWRCAACTKVMINANERLSESGRRVEEEKSRWSATPRRCRLWCGCGCRQITEKGRERKEKGAYVSDAW